jgi:hypothetical protein
MRTPTELAEDKRQAEADAAWRLCFRQHGFGEGSRQDAVEANFGPPSWHAILYDSPERQEQAEAAIEANRVRCRDGCADERPPMRNVPPSRRLSRSITPFWRAAASREKGS